MYTWTAKYEIVMRRVANMTGTLIDVGARDRTLSQYLKSDQLRYMSADVASGHTYQWDIEKPIDMSDNAFDVVVALDVLEHVENCHMAFRELLRITRQKLFISLPNMTGLSFRLHFLRRGELSGKYTLQPEYRGDRHRWLTSYPQVARVVNHLAHSERCEVQQYDILLGYGRWHSLFARFPLPAKLRTYTLLFEITKPGV